MQSNRGLGDLCKLNVTSSTGTNSYKMAMHTFRLEIIRFIAKTRMISEQGYQQIFYLRYSKHMRCTAQSVY